MDRIGRNAIIFIMIALLNFPAFKPSAYAEMIDTETAYSVETRARLLDKAEKFLVRDDVATALIGFGVERNAVMDRVALMTDDELLSLSANIDQAPAGAGAVEVVGIVFIVLIILELVGVTDIFKKF